MTALATELNEAEPRVFRDSDSGWTASIEATGRNMPENIEEAGWTSKGRFTVTLCGSAGFDSVGLLVDYLNEAATGETRVTDIVTRGADVLDGLCKRVGLQPYV